MKKSKGRKSGGRGKMEVEDLSMDDSHDSATRAAPRPFDAKYPPNVKEFVRTHPLASRLRDRLLSPACSTDKAICQDNDMITLDSETLNQLLHIHVANIDSMLCRQQVNPVASFIISTYYDGIPMFQNSVEMQNHICNAMKTIFAKLLDLDPRDCRKHLTRLAEAFQACQAVQARVIDSIYGQIIGRDLTFRDQVLVIVDEQKQRVLDEVTERLHPSSSSSSMPSDQIPHLQNSFKRAIGVELGFRGITAANTDYCATVLPGAQVTQVRREIIDRFSVLELCEAIVNDVNNQNENAERYINRDGILTWVFEYFSSSVVEADMFVNAMEDGYYQDDLPDRYNDCKPKEGNEFQPFVNEGVVFKILCALFL